MRPTYPWGFEMEFKVENWEDCSDGIKSLFNEHWEEVGHGAAKGKEVNPDYDGYKSLRQKGMLIVITARDKGKIVGYSIAVFSYQMSHKTTIRAYVPIVFLKREFRKGFIGYKFLKAIESFCCERSSKNVEWSVSTKNDWSPLLERMGYKLMTKNYGRE